MARISRLDPRLSPETTILIAGGSSDVGIAGTVFGARDLDYGILLGELWEAPAKVERFS